MAQAQKKKISVTFVIGILLMFVLGWILPTWGPVTRVGVCGICIFVGLVILAAAGYHYLAISSLALFAIQLSGAFTFNQMLAASIGGATIYQLIIVYGLCRALIECGAGDVIARWLITRKFAQGKPYAFTVMLMIASIFAGAFIGLGGLLFYYSVLEAVRKELGYEEHSAWMKFNVFGVYANAMIGMSVLPFKGLPAIIFGPLKQALDTVNVKTNDVFFIMLVAGFGIIVALLYYPIMRLFKVDCSRLENLDITKMEGMENVKMDRHQKWVSILFLISLIYSVLIIFIKPNMGLFGKLFNGITQAGWFAVILAVMCLIKVDGKQLANPRTVLKEGVDWNVIYAMIGFTQAGAVLTMDDAGIKAWLQELLSGVFVESGYAIFLLLVFLFSWILTNFLSNTAVGVIMGSIAGPFLVVHVENGANPTVFAAGFMVSVMYAFATQASCGAAPLLFGNKCISEDLKWLYSKGLIVGTIIFLLNYVYTLVLNVVF